MSRYGVSTTSDAQLIFGLLFWMEFILIATKKKNNRLEAIGGDSYLQIYIHTKNIMFAAQFDINSM